MDFCSTNIEGVAYAVVFTYSSDPGTCWCKGSNVSKSDAEPNVECPYTNGSLQSTANGAPFTIHCGQDMPDSNDYCPANAPTAYPEATSCPTHASSLNDCMDQCSKAVGLCLGVTYAPDMVYGYANCYFKSNASASNLQAWNSQADTRHMAIMSQDIFDTNKTCINGTTYTSPNNAEFEIACNTDRPLSDLSESNFHSENLTACTDACATYTNSSGSTCEAVVFDTTVESGYENCFLKYALGATPTPHPGLHLAQLSKKADGEPANTNASSNGDPSASPQPSPGSSSKAWIAGPVLGGLAGVAAILGAALFFLRRSKRAAAARASHQYYDGKPPGYMESNGNYADAYGAYKPPGEQQQPLEADSRMHIPELGGGGDVHELPEMNSMSELRAGQSARSNMK
ncbi:MAG: hypothetical protein M1820_000493 [Bogoriella megaspora]|nr:MAG: hypothetical protein M1820_000493 [Bogoriella megaspora]